MIEINQIINNKKKNLIIINLQKEIDDNVKGYKIQINNKCLKKIPLNYMETFILLINIIMKDYKDYPNYSHFLNIENIHKFLINQIKNNSVCKIINGKMYGSGFFCYIPYDNLESRLTVLMTTSKIIGNEDIKLGKKIEIKYINNNKTYFIFINSERKVYTNEKHDITFIEIKETDYIPNINYLEFDESINMNQNKEDKSKNIFLLHYPNDNPKLDSGIIINNEKKNNNYIIEYKCSSEVGSIGGSLLSNNYTIIGVHRGKKTSQNNLLDFSIQSFLEEFKNTLKNDSNISNLKNNKKLIKKLSHQELNDNLDNFIYKSIERLEKSFGIHNFGLLKNSKNINIIKKISEENCNNFYDVLCPKCKTSAIIDNEALRLNILNCNNFHRISNINYDVIEIESTCLNYKCNLCGEKSTNLTPPDNQMYICNCGSYICPLCFKSHSKNHITFEVENKNYICNIHGMNFNSYCIDCNTNICESCEKSHFAHEIIKFKYLFPETTYIESIKKYIYNQKEILKAFIDNTKKLSDNIIKEIESYINKYIIIESSIIYYYEQKFINHYLYLYCFYIVYIVI